MDQNLPEKAEPLARSAKLPHHLGELLHRLLFLTHRGLARQDFLHHAAELMLEFSGCDVVEIRVREASRSQRCLAWIDGRGETHCDCHYIIAGDPGLSAGMSGPIPEPILEAVLDGRFAAVAPFLTRYGSFWTGDAARPILLRDKGGMPSGSHTILIGGDYQSLALIPFPVDDRSKGVLQLSSRRRDFFTKNDIQFHEAVGETLGVALAHQAAQWALGERVKELTCLYRIGKAMQDIRRPVEELLREVVDVLPPGWQYPEITHARITFDGRSSATSGFADYPWKQTADVVVNSKRRGVIEVVYSSAKPDADEGPFLKEERNLINAIAETIGITLAFHGTQWALRERVKELSCLHAIAAVAQQPDTSQAHLLQQIVALLPPALQFPESTQARVMVDSETFIAGSPGEPAAGLTSDIFVGGQRRGRVDIIYVSAHPNADEGPFLKEERTLMNEVARQLGLILEGRETDAEMKRLQEQIRHRVGRRSTLAEVELEYMKSVLSSVQDNKSRAAEILGIDRKTLRKRLQELPGDD